MAVNTYIIENKYIKKTFSLSGGKITGFAVENRISGKTVKALENSEEFVVNFKTGLFSSCVKCSDLKLIEAKKEPTDLGCRHIFDFKPRSVSDSKVVFRLVYDIDNTKPFFRKYIELSFAKKGNKKIVLDYIDFENLRFESALSHWSVPEQKSSHIPGYALRLGQPIYLDSLYFGCEFPACLNVIENDTTSVRYYSGKDLRSLAGGGAFRSDLFVMGAAEGAIFAQVQKAFFEYIKYISKPNRLRRQYNSWYDHMLNITKQNITDSFLEIDKQLTATGEKPLDSYVVDDGWNDYSKDFWCFNEKFPDGLHPFSSLAESVGSHFGVWIGPRGGYTLNTPKFARKIQKGGNGYYNASSQDICVSSDKYVDKMQNLMLGFQKEFNLNYWKLDGFAQKPCRNRKHDHMVGGKDNLYFYTEVWEKWLRVFDKLYENGGNNFWINLTCYANPSPWFLMHVSSVWMQISDDVGFVGKKGEISDKDRMLSYRDDRYYDFYRNRQFQFPQRCLYNHDPIYGNEAKVSMNDEDFREYMFTMAMRGTSFWELYYSYTMMNKAKWRINYSVLRFIEDNFDVLSNSIIFGGRPSQGQVYGYSAFGDHEGIVCLRNSGGEQTDYTLRLDEHIGAGKTLLYAPMTTVLPYKGGALGDAYSYGDKIKVHLAPYQTKILHFGRQVKEMKADYVSAVNEKTVEVTFNQMINADQITCRENPVVKAELLEDYMSVRLTFENALSDSNELTLDGVGDIMGNTSSVGVFCTYYDGNIITDCIRGREEFSVKATLTGEDPVVLMRQGEDVSLRVTDDGHIAFTVGFTTLKSRSTVSDVVQVVAVREKTGVLKLYLNGKPDIGTLGVLTDISPEKPALYDSGKVVLYNKALAYDEV